MTTRRLLAVCVVAMLALGGMAGVSRSAHDGGITCYVCHTLQAGMPPVPGTALINPYVMYEFTSNGWAPGARLPCTFCHRGMNHPAIPNVLTYVAYDNVNGDYYYGKSRHPVARNYLDNSIGNTPYLSTDNSSTPGHLDCVDCHDKALLKVPNHNDNWLNNVGGDPQRRKSDNPFGLYNVSAPKAYDTFCRSCHARGVAVFPSGKAIGGRNLEIVSHDNGVAGNPIRDADNLAMRTQAYASADRQCSVCHDAHSSTNFHLYSDGGERDWNNNPETAIDEFNNCTNVCHYRGDVDNSYDVHGHGKRTFASGNTFYIECTSCHDASAAFHSAKRGGTYFEKYRFRVFDPTFTENSVYGNAKFSVCATCHQEKPKVHITARGDVGCLDCHDPHAKQSGNNVMMIRNTNRVAGSKIPTMTPGPGYTVGSEAVRFERSPKYGAPSNLHFYTSDNVAGDTSAGVCDQRACHGASVKQYTPLSVFMSGGQHQGQNQTAGSNCEGCHSHTDFSGSFRAGSSCMQCHGQPPPPTDNTFGEQYVYNETIGPHQKHAATSQYAYSCKACHNKYTDANYHNTIITLGYKTFQSVFFDNAYNRGGAASYDNGTMRCANLYCHSDGAGNAPDNNTFSWYRLDNVLIPSRLGCSGCHKNDSPLPQMATYAHKKHLDYKIHCSACHYVTVSDNNQVLNPSTGYTRHVDGTVDVTINPLFDNNNVSGDNWDPALRTCVSVTCHGGKTVYWRVSGPLSCEECHTTVNNGSPVAATSYDYTFDNSWAAALTMSTVSDNLFASRGHGRSGALPWDNASNPGGLTCQGCHDPSSLHGNPSNPFRFKGVVNTRAVAFDNITTLCAACHLDIAARSNEHSKAVTGGAQTNLDHAQRCVDCHDVHGQQNIFMVYDSLPRQASSANAWTNSDGYGIPRFPGVRSAVSFSSDNAGSSFASTTLDNSYADGVCETCHTRTRQFRNASGPNAGPNGHPTRACVECHTHVKGFGGFGGSNVEQYFDNAFSSSNFRDLSGHPLTRGASGGQIPVSGNPPNSTDCLRCHGNSPLGSGLHSNECLRCHHETLDNTYHPDGIYQWSFPSTAPSGTYATGPAADGFCLLCHSTVVGFTAPGNLGGISPTDVVPPLERWIDNNASGHGSAARLSAAPSVGPPSLVCRTCHYSSVAMATSPNGRDNRAPTFHASINRKMVGNENAAIHEFPHPGDNVYTDNDVRSGLMDGFCARKCHQSSIVVKHAWDGLGSPVEGVPPETQGGSSQTHPSNVHLGGPRYKPHDNVNLPLSEYITGAYPGPGGNVVCVTCHNPHGGAAGLKDLDDNTLIGGAKQMMRRSFSDNGTVCKECHL